MSEVLAMTSLLHCRSGLFNDFAGLGTSIRRNVRLMRYIISIPINLADKSVRPPLSVTPIIVYRGLAPVVPLS